MPKLVKREVILLKIESTAGQDSLPTPEDDALLVENPSIALEGLRMAERAPIRQSIAKLQSVYAGMLMTVSFDLELKGSGIAGTVPEIGQALRSAGLSETIIASTSVSYSPVSTGHESATIYYYEDGSLYILGGCKGTITGNLETGAIGKVSVSYTGHLISKTDTALVAPSYVSEVPAPAINVPVDLGGFAPVINTLSFDLGNELSTPPSMSAADGYSEVIIGGRNVTGSIDPEAVNNSVKDFLNELQSGTTQALTLGPYGPAGNQITISIPAVSFTEYGNGDRDNVRTNELSFEANEVNTDDELVITFS